MLRSVRCPIGREAASLHCGFHCPRSLFPFPSHRDPCQIKLNHPSRALKIPLSLSAAQIEPSTTKEAEEDPGDDVEERIWRSVPKPLMTVGRHGVQPSHCSSLKDLIDSHKLVKVKVLNTADGDATVQRLSSEAGVVFLQRKKNILLFASDQMSEEETARLVEESAEKLQRKKVKRENEQRTKKAPPSSVHLPRSVKQMLQSMEEKRMICSITFDTKTMQQLSRLTEKSQLEILGSVKKREFSRVRNKSAWLTSRIKVHQKALEQQES